MLLSVSCYACESQLGRFHVRLCVMLIPTNFPAQCPGFVTPFTASARLSYSGCCPADDRSESQAAIRLLLGRTFLYGKVVDHIHKGT